MPTIRDVAAAAGVAPSTVSNILSGKKKFSAPTVEKVMASIAELGYRPDSAARALALGRTNIIGFLASVLTDVPDPQVDVFMRFVRSAVYTARQRGFDVLLMGKGSEELEGDMLVDALVVMDIRHDDPRLAMLSQRRLPTVLVGVPPDSHGMSAFDLDWDAAARLSIRHLVELGHREIVCVMSPDRREDGEFAFEHLFRKAFLDEAADLGAHVELIACATTPFAVDAWVKETALRLPAATAIVVMEVGMLDILLRRIRSSGARLPRDLSVIAVAPAEEFAHTFPDITVVDIPGNRMVELAINRALDELAGATRGVQQLLSPVLVERGSTGPAPTRPFAL